ncbi:MAG: type IV pilin N-terminal domain-containing protein [Methanocorpusculum sp.]|nr:type IV pilin N-terminal domain-containing protein [Methanocorpusculum sp.]
MMMKINEYDDAVTSVVGEMLVIGLVVILVSLFAVSAFNLLPDAREKSVTTAVSNESLNISFYHKGGDWIPENELVVRINSVAVSPTATNLTDWADNESDVFDLGGCYTVQLPPEKILKDGDEVRLVASNTVLGSWRYPW